MQRIATGKFSSIGWLLLSLVCLGGCDPRYDARPLSPGATLEVWTISATPKPNSRAAVDPTSGAPVYLQSPAVISSSDVQTVAFADGPNGTPGLRVTLNAAGAKKLKAVTTPATGQQLAIVVNGQVVVIPTVRSQISTSFEVVSQELDATKLLDDLTRD